ncbi:MAG: FixH family protein [Deltaproteobacteria bacterium]|nr:FixH family protein [Deltaproteobacteria bacterium]
MLKPLHALLLACAVALTGCAASGDPADDSPLVVDSDGGTWTAEVTVRATGTGWVEVPMTLTDAEGAATGLAIESDVFMPAHGHGSSERITTTELEGEPGVYNVSAFFTMPGEWEITSRVDPEGLDEAVVFTVEALSE